MSPSKYASNKVSIGIDFDANRLDRAELRKTTWSVRYAMGGSPEMGPIPLGQDYENGSEAGPRFAVISPNVVRRDRAAIEQPACNGEQRVPHRETYAQTFDRPRTLFHHAPRQAPDRVLPACQSTLSMRRMPQFDWLDERRKGIVAAQQGGERGVRSRRLRRRLEMSHRYARHAKYRWRMAKFVLRLPRMTSTIGGLLVRAPLVDSRPVLLRRARRDGMWANP